MANTVVALVILVVGFVAFLFGMVELNPRPDWRGVTQPVSWGAVIFWWSIPALVIAFMIWGAVTNRKQNAGKTKAEIAEAQARAEAERAGYVKFNTPEKGCTQCPVPMYTGQQAKVQVGLGSIWRCPFCQRRWELVEHEHKVSTYRTSLSRWRPASG